MAVADIVIERGGHLHNLIVLHVERQRAPHSAVGADRVGGGLLLLVPLPGPPPLVLAAEHESASGTDADTIAAIHTGRLRQRHGKLGRYTGVKATTGNRDGERILRVFDTGFHTFETKDAAGIITDVELVIDHHGLGDRLGGRSVRPVMMTSWPEVSLTARRWWS